ncbi:Alw26I/Eco31I/Esp3I family type II restriction endonuclease [Sanyastnella coralliicola]|uniref:Alw26I/Eco31I/Esp3I family type II restriction endonuclease n=1 Tax=Sanyastnella coralliicola TaxID=3069118 RepID=UPI0027BA279F|nr:Alw26I/Eco31I/Esp3I family type II restriction endonuclease [Longitalea sp. SCSIO 12813]
MTTVMAEERNKYTNQSDELSYISDDPEDYGSKGENWAEPFVKYMKATVTHPVYEGMPDAVKDDGKIQWEAPSNRSGGKYQHTHQKRRDWWTNKAKSLGIDPSSDKWISKTAKSIHPTGEKPCKRCGIVLRIAYVYPQSMMIKRFKRIFDDDFEVSPIEPIDELLQRAFDIYGEDLIDKAPAILRTSAITPPKFKDIEALLLWVEDEYVPREPSLLSPGAMSNAPDRFDGFHSFNRCCRSKADKGRSSANLKSYSTDRRVFEYWSEGDWIAADRLMGLVRSVMSKEENADGGEGAPTADHIGPISLGFCHRPKFRLLSKEANSAKNNRMTLQDVKDLIEDQNRGVQVVSWYAKDVWAILQEKVHSEETSLRLSKIMRDNQRNAMVLLSKLFEKRQIYLLTILLELEFADFKVSFPGLRAENYITTFDSIEKEPRDNKYALEQKARRFRIGFEALRSYREKENRHLFIIDEASMDEAVEKVIELLDNSSEDTKELNSRLCHIVFSKAGVISEADTREIIAKIPKEVPSLFHEAIGIMGSEMRKIAEALSSLWDEDRYVRAQFELDD